MSGSGYYSQNDFRLHFGLARRDQVDLVEIAWPSGAKETFHNLPANHLFVIRESEGIVDTRKFGSGSDGRMAKGGLLGRRAGCCRSCSALHPSQRGSSRMSPPRRASTSGTRARQHRTSIWSRPWAVASPSSITTTMAGWTSSSRMARRSTTRWPRRRGLTNRLRSSGTASIARTADGTFSDVTEKAGVTGMPQNYYGMGAAVGDYDNDGFADLYVTNYGGNTLYRNNGDGTFVDVTKQRRGGGGGWSASAGFFDADNDGSSICS